MCLIIAPGQDGKVALLPRDVFDYVYRRNDDGFGAMWTEDGRVNHFKGIGMSADEIYNAMEEYVERFPNVVFHMRYKTHGKIITGLSHPFRVLHKSRHGKDLFFMHNGILGSFGNNLKHGQSDTTSFKDKVLVPLLTRNPDALKDPAIWDSFNKLTSGSRLVFMDDSGETLITADKTWNDRYGLTLSNQYMLPDLPKKYPVAAHSYTEIGSDVDVTSHFVHYRWIEEGPGSPAKSHWCSCPKPGYLRTETGKLYKDGGVNKRIYHALDYIKKDDEDDVLEDSDKPEARHLTTLVSIPSTYTPPKDYVDPNGPFDDDTPFEDDVLEDSDKPSEGPATREQQLRYARLVHNLYAGSAASREQLLGDLIGMGEAELGGFVMEDPENAHTVIAELVEMVLEFNDEMWRLDGTNTKVLDANRLLECGDINYHRQAMKDISNLRQKEYLAKVTHAAEKEEKKKETAEQRMEKASKKAWSTPVDKKEAA